MMQESLKKNNFLYKDTLGSFLKEERNKKQLTLAHISTDTKINKIILKNLENNNLKDLPDKAYVLGFIKSYIKILGISEKEGIFLFKQAYHNSDKTNSANDEQRKVTDYTQKRKQKNFISQFIFSIICLLSISYIFIAQNNKVKPPIKTKTINTQTLDFLTPLNIKKPPRLQPLVSKPAPATKSASPIIEDARIWPVKFFTKKKRELYSLSTINVEKDRKTFLPKKYRNLFTKKNRTLFINAYLEDIWITYKIDQHSIKTFILRKKKTLLLQGKIILITFGNIKMSKIFLDDQPLNILSEADVQSLIIPQEQSKKFFFPPFIYSLKGHRVMTSDLYMKNKKLLLKNP